MPYSITTPIYYVNARPHLGHAYTTIAADLAARHMRQRGEDVFFLTGTDEHSSGPARAAAAEGVEPQVFVDRVSAVFKQLTRDLEATNTFFVRTTDEGHKAFVRDLLQRVYDAGDIYESTYAGLYCSSCEAFYAESDLIDGLCPQHLIPPEWIEERNWFFRLSAYAERLLAHYDAQPDFVSPRGRMNEARSFIESGLEDFSISRATLTWGIPLPWDASQVTYVWFDALANYLSALTYAVPGQDLRERFWPATWQLMAKDILRFHAVYWPAMLISAGYDLPRRLFVHGYLTVRDSKMSKTVGNVLDPFAVIERYGLDALRYYVLRDVRFGGDGNVSYAAVHERYHAELANDLGNLVSRTVAMIVRYRNGAIPAGEADPAIAAVIAAASDAYAAAVDELLLTDALDAAWDVVRALNRFVEARAPWQLAKDPARSGALDDVLHTLADGIRAVAVMLASAMPTTANAMRLAVGADLDDAWAGARAGRTVAGARVVPGQQLFPRIEEPLE